MLLSTWMELEIKKRVKRNKLRHHRNIQRFLEDDKKCFMAVGNGQRKTQYYVK